MNLLGSYRALLKHSKSAMISAIEIYNKPQIQYRDEIFSILLINAWELLIKAILSKNGKRIYYSKKRSADYRTYSLEDAMLKAQFFFPASVDFLTVRENIRKIEEFRDNCIHFYNDTSFGVIIYGLAQPNIVNYCDLVRSVFGIDITSEMTITLLPLGFGIPPDPIQFLREKNADPPKNAIIANYLKGISITTKELEENSHDTARFLATFSINLQSIKKISSADISANIVTMSSASTTDVPFVIEKTTDPNKSHPLSQKDILYEIGGSLNGFKFTSYTFSAIIWKENIKTNKRYCYRPLSGSTQYSREFVTHLRSLSFDNLKNTYSDYQVYLYEKRLQS